MTLQKTSSRKILESVVTVLFLAYGIHYFGYFIRTRYYVAIDPLADLNPSLHKVLEYCGHVFYLAGFLLYGLFVPKDRTHFLAILPGRGNNKLYMFLIGCLCGFGMNGLCVLLANLHGDITTGASSSVEVPMIIAAIFAVLLQASIEEIETRSFLFGKLQAEGTPIAAAILVSSMFFSYLHASNPGYSLFAFVSQTLCGIFYLLLYYVSDSLWLSCGVHMMWNYSQDILFGLPDSGKPSEFSVFSTVVNGKSVFYDPDFGIEGTITCVVVHMLGIAVMLLLLYRRKKKTT